jgi:hypothetical protein
MWRESGSKDLLSFHYLNLPCCYLLRGFFVDEPSSLFLSFFKVSEDGVQTSC